MSTKTNDPSYGLHEAVRQLLNGRNAVLLRDDGSTDRAEVPSLWAQLCQASSTGSESQRAGNKYRAPVDLGLVDLRQQIERGVAAQLGDFGIPCHATLPASMRTMAVRVAQCDERTIEAWTARIAYWVRQARQQLGQNDDPQPRRIRDAACPMCEATHVTVMVEREELRVPALVIDFAASLVRAATCEACGASWFRGEPLNQLAELLGRGVSGLVA